MRSTRQQELYLKQLEAAQGREVYLDFNSDRDIYSIRGKWQPKEDAFLVSLPGDSLPYDRGSAAPTVAQVRVLAETGIHTFTAELDFIRAGLWRVRPQSPIKVTQNRAYIRLPVETRIQYQVAGETAAVLRDGLARNIAPGGMAFETVGEFLKGSALTVYFGEDPWRQLGAVPAVIIGHRVVGDDLRYYRVLFRDHEVSHQLVNMIIEEFNRTQTSPKRKRTG